MGSSRERSYGEPLLQPSPSAAVKSNYWACVANLAKVCKGVMPACCPVEALKQLTGPPYLFAYHHLSIIRPFDIKSSSALPIVWITFKSAVCAMRLPRVMHLHL